MYWVQVMILYRLKLSLYISFVVLGFFAFVKHVIRMDSAPGRAESGEFDV